MNSGINKTLALILIMLISTTIALADQKGKRRGASAAGMTKSVNTHVCVFWGKDRDLIRGYITGYGMMPPGLAKRYGDLPAGLERQLRRNRHLPPGLDMRLHAFPIDLERRLSPLRPGLIRGVIGVHAVIVDKKTLLIMDIFKIV
ncbi:MAG: hypothetical protein ABIN58_13190 [candidate division WOR-3 bacterium]